MILAATQRLLNPMEPLLAATIYNRSNIVGHPAVDIVYPSGKKNFLCIFPLPTTTADHDLIFVNLDSGQAVDSLYLERLPGNVFNDATALIDEVVVRLGVGIEHHPALGENELTEQSLLHQRIQGVVDGGPLKTL